MPVLKLNEMNQIRNSQHLDFIYRCIYKSIDNKHFRILHDDDSLQFKFIIHLKTLFVILFMFYQIPVPQFYID